MSGALPLAVATGSPDRSLSALSELQAVWDRHAHNLSEDEQKRLLSMLVESNYPGLPCYSTLDGAIIEETQKASVSGGAVLTYFDEMTNTRKVVMVKAGAHYRVDDDRYMVPGGFTNLSIREGSSYVAEDDERPETVFMSTAREIEEELRAYDGSPLIPVDPERLKLIDTNTLSFPTGEKRVVMGMVLELTKAELRIIQEHIARLQHDESYRIVTSSFTTNDNSKLPEAHSIEILELDDFLYGRRQLMHPDQLPLMHKAKAFLDRKDIKAGRGAFPSLEAA